jgi:hypothetical protein
MQDKLKSILKSISPVTAHPDADWLKILCFALVVLFASVSGSAYLFFVVRSQVIVVDSASGSDDSASGSGSRVDDIKKTIDGFKLKKQAHDAVVGAAATQLQDPASF